MASRGQALRSALQKESALRAVQGEDGGVDRKWGEWGGLCWEEGQLVMRSLSTRLYSGLPGHHGCHAEGCPGQAPGGSLGLEAGGLGRASCPWELGPGGDHWASPRVAESVCFKCRWNLLTCRSRCLLKVSNKNTLKIIKIQQ